MAFGSCPQAPTSSSLGKSVAAGASAIPDLNVNSTRDPMQKKLLQFRQQKATVTSSNSSTTTATTKSKAAVQTVAAAAGRGRPVILRERTTVASGSGSGSGSSSSSSSSSRSAASHGVGGASSTTGDGVFRIGVASAGTKRGTSSSAPNSIASAATGRGTVVGAKNGPKNGARTVSKPVTTVKRSVGGNAAAADGGRGRASREKSSGSGVKRKAPALLSGNVTDRKRWVERHGKCEGNYIARGVSCGESHRHRASQAIRFDLVSVFDHGAVLGCSPSSRMRCLKLLVACFVRLVDACRPAALRQEFTVPYRIPYRYFVR